MKKIILLLVGLAVYQNWHKIEPLVHEKELHPKSSNEVTLYATSWCGYCKATRALLNEKSISYTEYDIETSAEGRKQHADLGGGGVPVLKIGETVIHGYNKEAILTAVSRD